MPNPKGINQYSKGSGTRYGNGKDGTLTKSQVKRKTTAANKAAGAAWDKRDPAAVDAKYKQIRANAKRRATLAAKKK